MKKNVKESSSQSIESKMRQKSRSESRGISTSPRPSQVHDLPEETQSDREEQGTKAELINSFFQLNNILICGLISIIPIICAILVTKYYDIQTYNYSVIEEKQEEGIELTKEEKEFKLRYDKYKKTKSEEKSKNTIFSPRNK